MILNRRPIVRSYAMTSYAVVVALHFFCHFFIPYSYSADVISTWNGTSGNWSDPNRWDSALFPSNGNGGFTYDAIIGGGGTTILDTDIDIEALTLSGGTGGTITGSSSLDILSSLSWINGGFAGTGATTIAGGTISGTAAKSLNERTLELTGDVSWTDGDILATTLGTIEINSGVEFTAGGTSNRILQANVTIDPGGRYVNSGFRFTDLTGTLVNNGTVEVEADSALFVAGGSGAGDLIIRNDAIALFNLTDEADYQFTGAIELDGGTFDVFVLGGGGGVTFLLPSLLTGNGTYQANGGTLVNSTEISPGFSVGQIDIDGNYQQTTTGKLSLEVEDPNSFDTLAITGNSNLGGTLEVTLTDPSDAPVGTMIEVITASSVTNTFEDVMTIGVDDILLAPVYGANSVSLLSIAEGDMNPFIPGIGEEDAVAFALALTDPVAYRDTYGISADEAGDIDDIGDSGLDFDDIDDFVKLLNEATGSSLTLAQMFQIIEEVQAIPEPTGLALALLAFVQVNSRKWIHNASAWEDSLL